MNSFYDRFQRPQFSGTPEPFDVRFKRFLKTQPVLALLIGQAIVTYILLQAGFFYGLLFVGLLYLGGLFIRHFYSDAVLVGIYAGGAAAGYLAFGLMFQQPLTQPGTLHIAATQASAVFALLTFVSVAKPDLRLRMMFLLQIRFRLVAAVLMIFALLRTRGMNEEGIHLAALAGAAVAAIAAFIAAGRGISAFTGRIQAYRERRRKARFAKYTTVKDGGKPLRDEEYNDIRAERQKRIDAILDKISVSGYDSLTRAEKELLFQQSDNQ
jgi:hypothetical protein